MTNVKAYTVILKSPVSNERFEEIKNSLHSLGIDNVADVLPVDSNTGDYIVEGRVRALIAEEVRNAFNDLHRTVLRGKSK